MRRILQLVLALWMGGIAIAGSNVGQLALEYTDVLGDTLSQIKGFHVEGEIFTNQKIALASVKKGKLKDAIELLADNQKLFRADIKRALEQGLDSAVNGGPSTQPAIDLLDLAAAQNDMALGFLYRKSGSEAKAAKCFRGALTANTSKPYTKASAKQVVQFAKAQLKEMGY